MVRGDVYVRRPDGSVAVNVQGMPVEVFNAYFEALGKILGGDVLARNATKEEVSDSLRYGAWYVLGGEHV